MGRMEGFAWALVCQKDYISMPEDGSDRAISIGGDMQASAIASGDHAQAATNYHQHFYGRPAVPLRQGLKSSLGATAGPIKILWYRMPATVVDATLIEVSDPWYTQHRSGNGTVIDRKIALYFGLDDETVTKIPLLNAEPHLALGAGSQFYLPSRRKGEFH